MNSNYLGDERPLIVSIYFIGNILYTMRNLRQNFLWYEKEKSEECFLDEGSEKEKTVYIIMMYIKIINCCSIGFQFECHWSLFPLNVILLLFKCLQELLVPSCVTCSTHCSSGPLFPSTAPCILQVIPLWSSVLWVPSEVSGVR